MSGTLGDLRADYLRRLTVGGQPPNFRVTTNPAAGPPMILIDLVSGIEAQGRGTWRVEVPIKCIAQPPGDLAAVNTLESMVEYVFVSIGFAPFVVGTYRPTTEVESPMYTFTFTSLVPNPYC